MRQVTNERKVRKRVRGARPRAGTRAERAKGPARRGAPGRRSTRGGAVSAFIQSLRQGLKLPHPFLFISLGLVVLVLAAAMVSGGYARRAEAAVSGAMTGLVDEAGFGIENVRITGNARTPASTIVNDLNLEHGQPIFTAGLSTARSRLLKLDWVKDAEIRRIYPDTVSVSIVEKKPFALWQSDRDLFVVERSGAIITQEDVKQFAKLPKLVGDGANLGADIVDQVEARRVLAARVAVIERVGDRRWNLVLDNGVTVDLPENGWQAQLGVLEHLIIDKGVLERTITEIDLRSSSHFFFTLKPAPKKDDGSTQL